MGRGRSGGVETEIDVDTGRMTMVLIGTLVHLVVHNRCTRRVRSSYLQELVPEVVVVIGDDLAQEDTACETWGLCDAEYHCMSSSKANGCIYHTAGRGSI